jgi:hypothetical protein
MKRHEFRLKLHRCHITSGREQKNQYIDILTLLSSNSTIFKHHKGEVKSEEVKNTLGGFDGLQQKIIKRGQSDGA